MNSGKDRNGHETFTLVRLIDVSTTVKYLTRPQKKAQPLTVFNSPSCFSSSSFFLPRKSRAFTFTCGKAKNNARKQPCQHVASSTTQEVKPHVESSQKPNSQITSHNMAVFKKTHISGNFFSIYIYVWRSRNFSRMSLNTIPNKRAE